MGTVSRAAFWGLDLAKRLEPPLRRWVLPDRFTRVEVETSSRCNRGCHYCPVARVRRPDHRMSEALFRSIVDQLAEMGFSGRFSPHFFGEPLLDTRLEELMAYVRGRLPRARIVIYTNGDALNARRARSLLAAGVDSFVVTFEEPGESRAFREVRRVFPRHVRWRRFHVRHWDADVTHRYNRGGMVGIGARDAPARACQAPAVALVVDAWGKVKLCANDYDGRHDLGDLTTTPLRDVWESPVAVATRRALLAGVFEREICQVGSCRAAGPSAPQVDATR